MTIYFTGFQLVYPNLNNYLYYLYFFYIDTCCEQEAEYDEIVSGRECVKPPKDIHVDSTGTFSWGKSENKK